MSDESCRVYVCMYEIGEVDCVNIFVLYSTSRQVRERERKCETITSIRRSTHCEMTLIISPLVIPCRRPFLGCGTLIRRKERETVNENEEERRGSFS